MFMALDTLKCHDPYQKTVVCVGVCVHARVRAHEFPCVHTHMGLCLEMVYIVPFKWAEVYINNNLEKLEEEKGFVFFFKKCSELQAKVERLAISTVRFTCNTVPVGL